MIAKKYPRVGVGVLIFNDKKQLLLGKRASEHGKGTWGLVGGHLEFGESFEECAIREAKEECGLSLKKVKFYHVSNDLFTDEDKHYITIFCKATIANNAIPKLNEPDKISEWAWFEFATLPKGLFLPLNNLLKSKRIFSD